MQKNHYNNIFKRSELLKYTRKFFDESGFIEVQTNTAIKTPAPEEFIESITTSNDRFLRCSPEIAMKILLSHGFEKIYQLGSCFRADEYGSKHREEFTMLEFYQTQINYMQLLQLSCDLIKYLGEKVCNSHIINFNGKQINLAEVEIITVEEAFLKYCGTTYLDAEKEGIFDELMVTKIEPNLGQTCISALIDYPANRASLAQLKQSDPRFAERFELYIDGVELANAFGELTNLAIQKQRFAEANQFRAENNMLQYPECTGFFEALAQGLPTSSGCAIGFDRLAMVFCDTRDIADVLIEF
jgi:lysyl-tRNA synthetase class 2